MYRDENSEASDANAYGNKGKQKAVFQLVRQVRDGHAESKGSGPRWHGVELRLDGRVAVGLDDLGTEVGIAVRRHNQSEVHESADDDLRVFEHASNVSSGDGSFASGFALVDLESRFDIGAFVLGEPLYFFREVWQEEVEEEGHDDCQETL